VTRRFVPIAAAFALLAAAAPAVHAAVSPAQFAIAVAKSAFNGKQGAQWDALHPKYKQVVTRARFVACERKAAAAIGTIKVLGVAAEGTRVIRAKLPLLGTVSVNDVTLAITYRKGTAKTSSTAELDSLWVSNRARWVRVLTPTEYQAYKVGKCP
jgi:hypothetical protein